VTGEKGLGLSLHSPRDPWKEAEKLVTGWAGREARTTVVLGLGLGYHVLKLLPRLAPEQQLIIVEKEPEVLLAALRTLDLTSLLQRPGTVLLVHPDSRRVSRRLTALLRAENGRAPVFFGHPPSLRAHRAFFREVLQELRPAAFSRPRPLGVKQERFRVLVVNPHYFLVPEVLRAFRRLGHQVHTVMFDQHRERGEVVVHRIAAEIKAFAPDLVFTVNHLGLDRQGLLMEVFHHRRVPLASWYVDSPALILNLYAGRPSDLAYIFVWDPTFIPEVRALGFDQVFPLPLATDPDIFYPRPARLLAPWRSPVAFVGNSLVEVVEKKLACLPASPEFRRLFHRLARAYGAKPFRRLAQVLTQEGLASHPLIQALSPEELTHLEAGIIWEATRVHRLECIRRLAPFHPVIYGDPGWHRQTGEDLILRPEVNYYDQLPLVYGATVINFNVTSLQMQAAVNQRVFDAPAAGGFLLTDFKPQLAELFEVGREVVCYRHPGEIPELVAFYLKHERARQEVVSRARRRLLAEHTYLHRLKTMVEVIRRTI